MQIPKIAVKHNWRNARTKSGLYPIHISVYLSGEPAPYYPVKVPLNVSKEDWQGDYNHRVKESHIFISKSIAKLLRWWAN